MSEMTPTDGQTPTRATMTMTAEKFAEFKKNTSDETYMDLVEAFVVEAMTPNRFARFPMAEEKIAKLRAGEGRFSPFVVYNSSRQPFVVFLVGDAPTPGPIPTSIEMKAETLLNGVVQTQKLAGVAINPWDEGGVMIPTRDVIAAIRKRREETEGQAK